MQDDKKKQEPNVAFSRKKIGGEVPLVVNEVTEGCLYSGFFGTLDSARMKSITDKILGLAGSTGIEIIIIDLANIDVIDSAVTAHLARLGDTLTLVGVKVIYCGIMPFVAQTMITSGVDLKGFTTSRDLKAAIREVFRFQGYDLVRMAPDRVTK